VTNFTTDLTKAPSGSAFRRDFAAWAAARRAKNPEPGRIAARKYRAANLEIIREKDRGRRLKAKES
jgi:hypothetical protein